MMIIDKMIMVMRIGNRLRSEARVLAMMMMMMMMMMTAAAATTMKRMISL